MNKWVSQNCYRQKEQAEELDKTMRQNLEVLGYGE